MQNLSNEKEFDLHENETVVHMNGFTIFLLVVSLIWLLATI